MLIAAMLSVIVTPVWCSPRDQVSAGGNLCSQLQPTANPHWFDDYITVKNRVADGYSGDLGLERIHENLPRLQSQLDDPDAGVRIDAVLQIGAARYWHPEWDGADRLRVLLIDRLRRETEGQVAVDIIFVLSQAPNTPGLAPIVAELLCCERDPDLRSAAIAVAEAHPDPSMLEPLLEAWSVASLRNYRPAILNALAALKDPTSRDVALDGLKEGIVQAGYLVSQVCTQQDVPRIIDLYMKSPPNSRFARDGDADLVDVIAHIGGPEALEFLRQEVDRPERSNRVHVAELGIRMQLKLGKPEWTAEDERNCVSVEEFERRRLPALQEDVERLLRNENEPLFRNLGEDDVAGRTLMEWSDHLDPMDRVGHWRTVVTLLSGDPSKPHTPAAWATWQLIKALASLASQEAPTQPTSALGHIDEAISRSITAWSAEIDPTEPLQDVRARVQRLMRRSSKGPANVISAELFSGTYREGRRNRSLAFSLNADGSFEYHLQSCVIDRCPNREVRFGGTFHWEEGFLALEPGFTMKGYGVAASDLLMPVAVGERLYLVAESQMEGFCHLEIDRMPEPDWLHLPLYYVRESPAGLVEGVPNARVACHKLARRGGTIR